MWNEFKEFIARGNVLDLAVGIIIGGAFGAIVSSLVDNVIMPFVGILLGGVDFTSLSLTIGDAELLYGIFIQNMVDFLIIAFAIFIFIRFINSFRKKEEDAVEEVKEEEIDEQTQLLMEIRDLLKEKK